MQEFSDPRDAIQRARETLQRLDDADRQRRFEEQQQQQREQPADEFGARAPWDATNPRGHKSPASMSHAEFNSWVDAGKPRLEKPKPPKPQPQSHAAVMRAVEARLMEVVELVGGECGLAEAKLRADMKRELDGLRAELQQLQQRAIGDAADPVDLPQWPSWSDDAARH
jgi:hypothetical protein